MALRCEDEYEVVRCLVEGNFSDAALVRRKVDDSQFVVKKVNLTRILEPKYRQIAGEEAAILTDLHHPNILRVHNHFCELNNGGNLIYNLVTEHVDNWTLADELDKMKKNGGFFSENHVLWWSNQLISALKYLHSREVLHRNVRPNNIYLVNSNRDIKLGEFGFVKHEENNFAPQSKETACSMSYVSPEFLQGGHPYCKKCDLWSMGVVLFEVVSQKLPQNHNTPKLQFPLKTSNCYSKELLHFIRWVLSTDDGDRPGAEQVATHALIGEKRVEQIRTLFGLASPNDPKSIRQEEEELEPWKFHRRSSTIKATQPWVSALLQVKGKDYVLVVSYSGHISAISKNGETVLWKAKIFSEARGGIWHAAVDDHRGRLYISYNGSDDPLNVYPVDIYWVPLEKLEPTGEHASSAGDEPAVTVKAELFFHHEDFRCFGLCVDPNDDLIYVCDWFDNKIGIWRLEGMQSNKPPVHLITKPEQFKHFNPTRCVLIPKTHADKKAAKDEHHEDETVVSLDEPKEQQIAVSDWLRSRIYLFKTISIKSSINHEFESIITSKGSEVGLVSTPIDLQCDPTARTLIVCDQANHRAQVLIPNPEWPKFKAIATENLGGHFSAVAITEVEHPKPAENHSNGQQDNASLQSAESWESSKIATNGPNTLRVLMAGLNTGEVVSYKFKCG